MEKQYFHLEPIQPRNCRSKLKISYDLFTKETGGQNIKLTIRIHNSDLNYDGGVDVSRSLKDCVDGRARSTVER